MKLLLLILILLQGNVFAAKSARDCLVEFATLSGITGENAVAFAALTELNHEVSHGQASVTTRNYMEGEMQLKLAKLADRAGMSTDQILGLIQKAHAMELSLSVGEKDQNQREDEKEIFFGDVVRLKRRNAVGNRINDAIFSPDGKSILVTHQKSPTASIIKLANGRRTDLKVKDMWDLSPLFFHTDSESIYSRYDTSQAVTRFSVRTGERLKWDVELDAIITSGAISPDGKVIALGGLDGNVWRYYASSGEPTSKYPLGHESSDSVTALSFLPNSVHLMSGGKTGTARKWNVASQAFSNPSENFLLIGGTVQAFAFSKDSNLMAVAYRTDTGGNQIQIYKHFKPALSNDIHDTDKGKQLIFTPNEKILISRAESKEIRFWHTDTLDEVKESAAVHDDKVMGMGLGPDGKTLYSADKAGNIYEWEFKK